MTGNTSQLSMLIMNVNDLNASIKRHRITNWVEKNKIQPYVVCKRLISLKKNSHWLRVKVWENVFQAKGPHKQAGVAIFISDKINFRLQSENTRKVPSY
jgi:hypothetical protein